MTEANSIKFDRAAGLALILGSIAGLITMALHPTGHDVLNSPNSALFMRLSIAVHALALLASPTMFLGALGLSRRLSLSSLRVLTALAFYVFAQVTVVSAAVMSGFVNTFVARQIANAAPPATDVWSILFRYTGYLNQGYSLAYVVGSSLAILLWSLFMFRAASLSRGLGLYGLILSPTTLIAVLSGYLALNVHGFGSIVLAQAIWFISAGMLLCVSGPASASAS